MDLLSVIYYRHFLSLSLCLSVSFVVVDDQLSYARRPNCTVKHVVEQFCSV